MAGSESLKQSQGQNPGIILGVIPEQGPDVSQNQNKQ